MLNHISVSIIMGQMNDMLFVCTCLVHTTQKRMYRLYIRLACVHQ